MIKAVLFDLGGTLHVSKKSPERRLWFAKRIMDRLGDYGIDIDDSVENFSAYLVEMGEAYKSHSEETLREEEGVVIWGDYYLRKYDVNRDKLAYCAEELCFLYHYERSLIMRRPHLYEMINGLKRDNIRMGIISNAISKTSVAHYLDEYGIAKDMDCVINSSIEGIRKPAVEIFRRAEKAMGLAPEELAYVGDTISRDVRGTKNAGWKLCIQIENPGSKKRDVDLLDGPYKPDYYIHDLGEIPEIIRKENLK